MVKSIPERKRILLACFSCSPLWGSEPGVGWNWVKELLARHDVTLVTHGFYREHLEPELSRSPIAGLHICYLSPPGFGTHPHRQLNSRLFYIWWQIWLRSKVRQIHSEAPVDLIHHLTWGTFRFPSFLGDLGVPFVMGPLGGGDVAPMRLYKGLPLSVLAFEWLRYLTLIASRFDPLVKLGPRASIIIFCKTEGTVDALPASVRSKTLIAPEIGAPDCDLRGRREATIAGKPIRLLFAGRLLGLKGITMAIRAVWRLRNAGHDVTLDIAGDGPLHAHLKQQIEQHELQSRVKLLGKVPRTDLMNMYRDADLFVFPSLHDSSGNVVLESLSRGLPVVCLDLGGPKLYLTPECGVVVSTRDRSVEQVEEALAHAIAELILNPARLRRMSIEAGRQATIQTWASRVKFAYDAIEQRLGWSVEVDR